MAKQDRKFREHGFDNLQAAHAVLDLAKRENIRVWSARYKTPEDAKNAHTQLAYDLAGVVFVCERALITAMAGLALPPRPPRKAG